MERLDSLSPDELIQIILDQQRLIEQLRAEIEQLKRRGSAAPFSKGSHKPNPKRAGRKPGQGSFRRRSEPKSAAEQQPVEVPVDADRCPECGEQLLLRINLVEPKLGAMIAGLVGLSAGAGFSGLLLIYLAIQAMEFRASDYRGFWRFVDQ